jgi:hypothetical protein
MADWTEDEWDSYVASLKHWNLLPVVEKNELWVSLPVLIWDIYCWLLKSRLALFDVIHCTVDAAYRHDTGRGGEES